MIIAHRMVKFWVRPFSCSDFNFSWMSYSSFTSSLRSAFSASLTNWTDSLSLTGGGKGFGPLFFLISERDNVVFCSSACGSVKSRIALEISLEFWKFFFNKAWCWIDLRNFVKLCPLCSVLVPKVSISAIWGLNRDWGLLLLGGSPRDQWLISAYKCAMMSGMFTS